MSSGMSPCQLFWIFKSSVTEYLTFLKKQIILGQLHETNLPIRLMCLASFLLSVCHCFDFRTLLDHVSGDRFEI